MKPAVNFKREYIWHILFWAFFVGYKIAFERIRVTFYTDSVDTFFIFLIYIANFYYVLYCLKNWAKRSTFFSVFLVFVGYVVYLFVLRFYCKVLIPGIGHGLYYVYQSWKDLIIDGTDFYIQFFFYAFGFWFVSRNYIIRENLNRSEVENARLLASNLELQNKSLRLENENLQLQHENLENEFNYLKAQINPHFLYNTLSYFYTETEQVRPNVAKGLDLLIGIMRYSLHRDASDGNAPLADEVEHLENFIELLQLRFNNTLQIQYDKEGNMSDWRIPPHLLITLVENAIKHGVATETEHPVMINLYCSESELKFSTYNKVNPTRKVYGNTGIGLPNVVKRLEVEYNGNARLEYGVRSGFFSVNLHIRLNKQIPAQSQ